MESKKTVVVIGGGYGGVPVAQKLAESKDFFVVLIDRKEYFFHHLASLRAATTKGWEEKPLIPYASLFSKGNGQFIQAEVERIQPDGVKIHGVQELIKYDYLVVATGTSFTFPFQVGTPSASDARKAFKDTQERIAKALSITIIGAGAVGIELAGEITETYGDTKKITIVHSSDTPLQDTVPQFFRDKVQKLLQSYKHIVLITGEKLLQDELTNEAFLEGKRTLKTDKGTVIETDLTFLCVGGKLNTASFDQFLPLDANGRVQMEPTLQVKGHSNIFALGDIANADNKMAFVAGSQATLVASNIIALNGKGKSSKLQEYSKVGDMAMAIPFGSSAGLIRMGRFSLGSWVTGYLKGWDLGSKKAWGMFKLQQPTDDYHVTFKTNQKIENSDLDSISKLLKVSKETARLLLEGVSPSQDSLLVSRT